MAGLIIGRDYNGTMREFGVDRVTGGFPCISTDHSLIHEGIAFTQAQLLTIANTKTGTIRITTPDETTAAAASHTFDMTNATSDLTYTAVTAGADGNDISVVHVDPSGNSQPLAISVSGQAITVSLATDGSGTITSTAAEVKTAVNADASASALVTCEDEGAGTGVVNALAVANLTGGTNPRYIHFKPSSIQASHALTVYLYEGATVTGTETAKEPRNRDRFMPDDSSVAVSTCEDATVAANTVILDAAYVPGGTVASKVGGAVDAAEEWVLDGGTDYVIAISNASDSSATVAYSLFWYEESGA